jgi:phenylalanine-4-hydroxylase
MGLKSLSKYKSKELNEEGLINYTEEENGTWKILYNRQFDIIKSRACKEYVDGLEKLYFSDEKVPQHLEVNNSLKKYTGWEVAPVPALIEAERFFTLLSQKKFPAASFIRTRADLDYLMEPDIFHELFGHCPLLTNDSYAGFMEEFGKFALTIPKKKLNRLFRIFWFTIEFGLIEKENSLKIYGGGILSSKEESFYSLESNIPERINFDPLKCLRTPFRIDILQPIYYVIDSFESLFSVIEMDIKSLLDESIELGSFKPKFPPRT